MTCTLASRAHMPIWSLLVPSPLQMGHKRLGDSPKVMQIVAQSGFELVFGFTVSVVNTTICCLLVHLSLQSVVCSQAQIFPLPFGWKTKQDTDNLTPSFNLHELNLLRSQFH